MDDFFSLQQRYKSLENELREAREWTIRTREELVAHPVSQRDLELFSRLIENVNQLHDKYINLDKSGGTWREELNAALRRLDSGRQRIRQNQLFEKGGVVALICVAEVVCIFLLSAICLVSVPFGIWATGFLFLSAVFLFGTLIWANVRGKAGHARCRYLIEEASSLEDTIAELRQKLDAEESRIEEAYREWEQADEAFRRQRKLVRPRTRFDKAVAWYKEVKRNFLAVNTAYERVQGDKRLHLLLMNWKLLKDREFEEWVAEVFRCLGYEADVRGRAGDQGCDVIAVKDGTRVGIQCKGGYESGVDNSAVQQVVAGMKLHNYQRCICVSNSYFRKSAEELAHANDCILIDAESIPKLIHGAFML